MGNQRRRRKRSFKKSDQKKVPLALTVKKQTKEFLMNFQNAIGWKIKSRISNSQKKQENASLNSLNKMIEEELSRRKSITMHSEAGVKKGFIPNKGAPEAKEDQIKTSVQSRHEMQTSR